MASPASGALTPPNTRPGAISSILAVAITSLVGVSTTYFAPIEIGAIIDRFGLSAAKGGAIVSVELGLVALTSLLAGGWLSHANTHRIAILSCIFVALANIACAFLAQIGQRECLASKDLACIGEIKASFGEGLVALGWIEADRQQFM